MIVNRSFKDFKFRHRSNKNQIIYTSKKIKNDDDIINLIDNFLDEKNSFIFESVEKGKIKGRYTIFGKNPDKIWEFNNQSSYLIKNNKKIKLKDKPDQLIEKIIEEFKFETPKNLPKICSLISGYFSYDSIRYIEKIPNSCKNDLNIPDVRLLRPRTLVIHDNLKKEIFYISNIFKDEKITNYENKFSEIKISCLEGQQSYFRIVEEHENNYTRDLMQLVNELLEKASKEELPGDIPDEASSLLIDRDTCMNAITGSHDIHVGRLYKFEDEVKNNEEMLCKRTIRNYREDEHTRSRNRIVELKAFEDACLNELMDMVSREVDDDVDGDPE